MNIEWPYSTMLSKNLVSFLQNEGFTRDDFFYPLIKSLITRVFGKQPLSFANHGYFSTQHNFNQHTTPAATPQYHDSKTSTPHI